MSYSAKVVKIAHVLLLIQILHAIQSSHHNCKYLATVDLQTSVSYIPSIATCINFCQLLYTRVLRRTTGVSEVVKGKTVHLYVISTFC